MRVVSEPEFRTRITASLSSIQKPASVTGPGRSGAVAAVYASHILHVPFVPYGQPAPSPTLIIDTAAQSGRTLRKAMRRYNTELGVAVYHEPPRVKFWYEVEVDGDDPR